MIVNKIFSDGLELIIPELAETLSLVSPLFKITKIMDGGMGLCAQIQDSLGNYYAIKVIHEDLLREKKSIERYIYELKTWLTLSSCNGIVEALCIVRLNDIPCIVSRWMEGGDLNNYINIKDIPLFYQTIDRICVSLKWVYSKFGIIHRDLKPGNILMDGNKMAFIGDWGLAKDLSISKEVEDDKNIIDKTHKEARLTNIGSFIGTVMYAAPEQILGLADIDFKADIYSLGCIMYQWETGELPFKGNSIDEIANTKLRNKPEKISEMLRNNKFRVGYIISKCLENDPSLRYESYEEIIDDIEDIASKQYFFNKCIISERYRRSKIGYDEFSKALENRNINCISSSNGYIIVDQSDIDQYLKEANYLINLGEYLKAKSILELLFVEDLYRNIPDDVFVQYITINFALTLNNIGDSHKALDVIRVIEKAKNKPSVYYVNIADIYIHLCLYKEAEKVCKEGLSNFPKDKDLIGNITIAAVMQENFADAIKFSKERLMLSKDIHSLSEAGLVYYKLAEYNKNINFPSSISYYKKSLSCYESAEKLNPNFTIASLQIANILYKLRKYVESSKKVGSIKQDTGEMGVYYIARNMLWISAFEEGKNFCDKWLKIFPDSILIKRIRAEIIVDGYVIGHYQDGIPILEKSSFTFFSDIMNDSKHRLASDFIYFGKLLYWVEDFEHSLEYIEKGIELFPNDWGLHFLKSNVAMKKNDISLALIEANTARQKAPWREKTFYLLAKISNILGNIDDGKRFLERYERIKDEKEKTYKSV
jgi:serine/threonine protein kinase